MNYEAEISRSNPTCVIFLIDQSGSMTNGWAGDPNIRKADKLADIINRFFENIILKCTKGDKVLDRLYVGVIGYGATVGSAFGGQLAGKELIPISSIADNPIRVEERKHTVEDGAGGLVDETIKFPVFFDPAAGGATPMCQALNKAQTIVQNWVNEHPTCYTPTVFNLTDGEATDGDPEPIAEKIKVISCSDGNIILFNIHISSIKKYPIDFPDRVDGLPDEFARKLFQMSSILPDIIQNEAKKQGYNISETSRGFVYNSDISNVIKFLDIGTRTE